MPTQKKVNPGLEKWLRKVVPHFHHVEVWDKGKSKWKQRTMLVYVSASHYPETVNAFKHVLDSLDPSDPHHERFHCRWGVWQKGLWMEVHVKSAKMVSGWARGNVEVSDG